MTVEIFILRVFLISAVLFFAAFYIVCFGLAFLRNKTPRLACSSSVSVVIPARNEEGVIDGLLRDLKNSSYPITETIVVDDNSSDSTYKAAWNVNAKIIRNETTLGKAASINKAAEIASSDIIVVFDADNRPQNDCIQRLMQDFTSEQVGAAAGVIKIISRGFVSRLVALEFSLCFSVFQPFSTKLGFLPILHGAFFAMRRDLALFDQTALTEDFDISITMSSKGYKMAFEPEAVSYVSAPSSFSLFAHQRERWVRGAVQSCFRKKNSVKKAFPRIGLLGLFLKALEYCLPLVWASNLTLLLLSYFLGETLLAYVALFSLVVLTLLALVASIRGKNKISDVMALPLLGYFYLLFVVWYFLKSLVLEYFGYESKFSKIPHR